jgi:branched-chain amino acid transport system permease protein
LNLSAQSVLVGTLAFATIIENALITEKWLTNGVIGFGTVKIPFKINNITDTAIVYAVILLVLAAAFVLYAYKVKKTPYGRLLQSIKDNEPLSISLGKSTLNHKILFFAVTSTIIALFGALSAPVHMYLFPRLIGPGLTFTVWIALLIGGRKNVWGAIVGVLVTVGLFDYLTLTIFNFPENFIPMYTNVKYLVFGLVLILVFMFMPNGIITERKRKGRMQNES